MQLADSCHWIVKWALHDGRMDGMVPVKLNMLQRIRILGKQREEIKIKRKIFLAFIEEALYVRTKNMLS